MLRSWEAGQSKKRRGDPRDRLAWSPCLAVHFSEVSLRPTAGPALPSPAARAQATTEGGCPGSCAGVYGRGCALHGEALEELLGLQIGPYVVLPLLQHPLAIAKLFFPGDLKSFQPLMTSAMGCTKQPPSRADTYRSTPIPVIPIGGTGILGACPRHTVALLAIPKDIIAGFGMGCLEGLAAGCPYICWATPTWTRLHQSGGSSGCPQRTSSMHVHLKHCSSMQLQPGGTQSLYQRWCL